MTTRASSTLSPQYESSILLAVTATKGCMPSSIFNKWSSSVGTRLTYVHRTDCGIRPRQARCLRSSGRQDLITHCKKTSSRTGIALSPACGVRTRLGSGLAFCRRLHGASSASSLAAGTCGLPFPAWPRCPADRQASQESRPSASGSS